MLVSPREEPQQLVDDRLQVQLLGGHQRKAVAEIEAHLMAEHRARAGAGAVVLLGTVAQDLLHQVVILAHGLRDRSGPTIVGARTYRPGGEPVAVTRRKNGPGLYQENRDPSPRFTHTTSARSLGPWPRLPLAHQPVSIGSQSHAPP